MSNVFKEIVVRHGRDARVTFVFFVALSLAMTSVAAAQKIELVNNQPFEIRMPLRVRGVKLEAKPSAGAQQDGKDLIVLADVPASQSRTLSFDDVPQLAAETNVTIQPAVNGVSISLGGEPMGELAWSIVRSPAATGEPPPSTKRDFAGAFKPLALQFARAVQGPMFESWKASAAADGLKLDVNVTAYKAGFLDVTATVTNESAPKTKVYAAVVTRWRQPKVSSRTLCYDNRRKEFADGAYSTFREGEGRQLMIQRGVDWINTRFENGAGVTWLNDFSPSFTVHRDKTEKLGARWVGANTAQLAQEAQGHDGAIYSICEIARPNIKQYQPRLSDNVLPGKDQPLRFVSRLAFDAQAVSDDAADQRFVGYVGYNSQQKSSAGAKISFGVPFTRMGTNYFPFSTLGENLGHLRMPGMSKEGYWPLAPATVNQWPLFADDIKRDLRTIKALGYELVRLHHLEVIYDIDKKTGQPFVAPEKRWEYLDFFYKEIEHLQLKTLLDVKLPAPDVAELVKRYGKFVDGVEYDNEVLIFQIYDEDIPVWKEVYDAVKKVDPKMPFNLTAHTNTGAFNRLVKEGVNFDRVGQHTYMDGLDPIPSSRGYALSMANYAAKHGKEPLITEWNWRFMTRMPMEERAKVYAPIFENVLASRAMPIMYQFQYQDSLAMNPAGLKGIRRYEQLLLSRRPKPEAMVMAGLIEKYSAPDSVLRKTGCDHVVTEVTGDSGMVEFVVMNKTDQSLSLALTLEGPTELKIALNVPNTLMLQAREKKTVPVPVSLSPGALPGFYHVFLRIEAPGGAVRYAWGEVRKPGNVTLDKAESGGGQSDTKITYGPGAMDFNFNRPLTVVYPDETAPKEVKELESAWTVFITLESATGRPVDIYQMSDFKKLADAGKRTVVQVVRENDAKPTIRVEDENKLVIVAGDEQGVMDACMDLVVRYWKNAKDSGARRVGLVKGTAAEAGGKTDLD